MYRVFSYIYEYNLKGNFLKCNEKSCTYEGSFDLSYIDIQINKDAMEKIGSEVFSDKFKGKTHRRFYAIEDYLKLPSENDYDKWNFIITNSYILLGYSLVSIR